MPARRCGPSGCEAMVEDRGDRVREIGARLDGTYGRAVEDAARRYKHVCQLLDSYSYENILKRGYAMVTDSAGHLVASAAEAKPGDAVDLRFHDGSRGAVIAGAGGAARPPQAAQTPAAQAHAPQTAAARPAKRDGGSRGSSGGASGNQGSLL